MCIPFHNLYIYVMKKLTKILFVAAVTLFTACNSTTLESKSAEKEQVENTELPMVVGKWRLTKTEDSSKKSKEQQGLSVIVMDIQKNGYFIIYDTFVDPNWKKKGLPLIEQRASGQWNLEGENLTLTYSEDQNGKVEELQVTKLTSTELVTKNEKAKSTVYKTYGKK